MPAGEGTSGAMISAMPPASTRRTRGGTNRAPNTGATMKQAPIRTNGQKYLGDPGLELSGGEVDHGERAAGIS